MLNRDRNFAIWCLRERVENAAIRIKVPERHLLPGNRQMAEAIDLLSEWPPLRGIDLEVVEIGPASTREEEAGRVSFEFQMLEIVVVTGKVKMDAMLLEQRVPVSDQCRVVTVRSIRIHRVMCQHRQKRRLSLLFEF